MQTAAPPIEPTTHVSGVALEPRLYIDPSLLEAEQELIFERTWQLAGHVSQLPKPGSYLTARAGTQPVLVVRDEEQQLRAFKNVCRHRGSRLLSGSGQCKAAIRCRYHGWTYRLDGSLIGVPEGMSFDDKIDKSKFGLMPARVEELCGLVFVNLDPDATPLAELVGDLPQRLAPYRIETLEPFSPATGSNPANWKAVADNYLEGYHIPIAHPGLMRLLDYKHYEVEVHEHYMWFDAPLRSKPSSNPPRAHVRQARDADARPRRVRPVHLALRLHLPEHDDRPVPGSGQHLADDPRRTRPHDRRVRGLPSGRDQPPHPTRSVGQQPAQHAGRSTRTSTSSTTSSRGSRPAATAAVRCRAASAGLRGSPTGSGPTWHRRSKTDEPAPRDRGTRADPRGRGTQNRQRGDRRRPDRPDRDRRGRLDVARALPLRQPRGAARRGARLVLHARRRRPDRGRRAAPEQPRRAPAVDDRGLPADHPGAARGLGPVGRAVAASGPPSGARSRSPRSSTHGCTRGSRTRSPPASRRASSIAATPTRSPTARWR